MLVLILMNLIVGTSAFLLNYRVLKHKNRIDSLISFFILYYSQIILTELMLGVIGGLTLYNVILINLAALLAVLLIPKSQNVPGQLDPYPQIAPSFLRNRVVLFLACVIAAFGVSKVFVNLVNPPFGWDDLNYHFTFAVEWLKHGNLNIPITINDDPSPSYYPINGSLFFLWWMLPLKSVFLADLGQVPFFVVAFFAVFSIARKLNLKREYAFYAAALFTLIPNYFKQLQIAYVDVMVGSLFLVCVNWLFLLQESFSWQNVLVYSLSLGLLIGTKTLALPYSALLLVPFVYLAIKNVRKLNLVSILIVSVFLLGSFSYIRNLLETGNPFYPLDFMVSGKAIFKGVMDMATYRAHFKMEDYRIGKALFHEGLSGQTLLFILPGILLALPVALIKRRKQLSFNLVYFLVLPILLYCVYRYVIPLANVRYLYALLGVGIVSGFWVADLLNIPKLAIKIAVVVCAIASMSELAKRQELTTSMVLTFVVFLLSPYFLKQAAVIRKFFKKPLTVIACIVILFAALTCLEKFYVKNEYSRYTKMVKYSGFWPDATKAWDWLNHNTRSDNIAYVGRPVPFPLYGTSFKNNVYYVSVNSIDPVKLHNFPHSRYRWGYDFMELHKSLEQDGNYRGAADYCIWFGNLMKHKTDYLFVYSLHQTKEIAFPLEDAWARAHPDNFNPVFTNDTIHIYKIAL